MKNVAIYIFVYEKRRFKLATPDRSQYFVIVTVLLL